MWERGERKQVLDGKRGKKVQNVLEERETTEHMWNGCSEMRERERKERGKIQNEDGREIGWMKETWKRRDKMEKKVVEDRKKKRNPKVRRANKALSLCV
jgi:hypothetical protein